MKSVRIINTKFVGASNSRGSHVVAACDGKRVSFSYDHALSASGNHLEAAKKLIAKNRWKGRITGESDGPGGRGFSYVLTGG